MPRVLVAKNWSTFFLPRVFVVKDWATFFLPRVFVAKDLAALVEVFSKGMLILKKKGKTKGVWCVFIAT